MLWPLLLLAPERAAALVQAHEGGGFFAAFVDAWGLIAMAHPDDPDRMEAFTRYLTGLNQGGRADPVEAQARVQLLVWRGRTWRQQGHLDRAQADLNRAAALGAALKSRGAPLEPSLGWPIDAALADGAVERALIQVGRRQPDAAIQLLLEALDHAPCPEVFGDTLSVKPGLEPLHHHPRWAEVMAARGLQD